MLFRSSANYYKGSHDIQFSCVRYGNVLGSRGSIVPTFIQQIQSGKNVTVTDPEMTRFNITMEQALQLILRVIENNHGGEVFIPKLESFKVGDMKDAIVDLLGNNADTELIPVRPGEKYHEVLINKNEIKNTYESNKDYIIVDPQLQEENFETKQQLQKAILADEYSSNSVRLLTKNELKHILTQENLIPNISHI